MICPNCKDDKQENNFRPKHPQCRKCEREKQYKKNLIRSTVMSTDYNNMSYVVGLFLGEFKGLKNYL